MPTSYGYFRCRLGPSDVPNKSAEPVAQVRTIIEPICDGT